MASVVIATQMVQARASDGGSGIGPANIAAPRSDCEVLIDLVQKVHGWDVTTLSEPFFQCSSSNRAIRALLQAAREFKFSRKTLKTAGDCDVLLSWGDWIGLPNSLMLGRRSPVHIIISYDFALTAKKIAYGYMRPLQSIDRFLVLTTAQKQFWEREIGISGDFIDIVGGQVDIDHFDPVYNRPTEECLIATAGIAYRDYPTLIRAVAGTPKIRLAIDPFSPWTSLSPDELGELPDNVTIVANPYGTIRDFYAKASIVAVPLHNTILGAGGMTLVLQAMAMAKPVIVTATNGLCDILAHETNCLVVAPGDEAGWRASIRRLSEDATFAVELGANARRWVTAHASVDVWAERAFKSISRAVSARMPQRPAPHLLEEERSVDSGRESAATVPLDRWS